MKTKHPKNQVEWASSKAQLAASLNVSRGTVQEWALRADFPTRGTHGWNVEKVRCWRDATIAPQGRRREAGAEGEGSVRGELLRAQADERRAKADLAGLQLKVERGEFRATKEIQEWDLSRLAIFKRGLLALGRSLAPALVGLTEREIEAAINHKAREMLERWARM